MPRPDQLKASVTPGMSVTPSSNADINSLLGGVVDRKKWYWYDTLKLAAGTTVTTNPYSWFAQALNQNDPNNNNVQKTFLETNVVGQGGQFSSPYDMVLTNLGFKYASDNRLYDINQFEKYGYFQFNILEKVFFKGHVWRHPPGAGLTGMSTQTTESVWNNGVADPASIYYFGQWSKYIPPLTTFGLQIQFFETVGIAYAGSNTGALGASAAAAGQSAAALPTLLPASLGGNGLWVIAIMNGLSDGPVQ